MSSHFRTKIYRNFPPDLIKLEKIPRVILLFSRRILVENETDSYSG